MARPTAALELRSRPDDWYQRPSVLARDLDPGLMRGHFVLSRDAGAGLPGWSTVARDGWHLAHEAMLPCVDVVDAGGTPVGWVLGHAIDLETRRYARAPQLSFSLGSTRFDAQLDQWLARLAGRFAAVITRPRAMVMADAFSALPVLFDPPTRRVSSSPLLLADGDGRVPDSDLVDTLAVYRTNRYYPFGLTSHATARLLLAFHVLDLGSFEQRRVWPTEAPPAVSPTEAASRVAELVEATIEAGIAEGGASLSLTAGGDSRMLLACSRELVDRLRVFTVPFPDLMGRTDVRTASEIANRLGLDYRVLPWVEPTEADVRTWMTRTGALCGEARGRRGGPTYAQLDGGAYISGVGFEVARGLKWQLTDCPDGPVSPVELLAHLGFRPVPTLVDACERWLAELPALSAFDVIDLAYHEIPGASLAGPLTLGYPEGMTTTIYPFGLREIVGLSLGLPYEARKGDALRRAIIAGRWPELGEFALNDSLLRHRVRQRATRLSQLPGGAVRRIARMASAQRRG